MTYKFTSERKYGEDMLKDANAKPSRPKEPKGRPATSQDKIWNVVKDGRERTTTDICNALKITTASGVNSTRETLDVMVSKGWLSVSGIRLGRRNIKVWRATK